MKKCIYVLAVLVALTICVTSYVQAVDLTQDEVISKAKGVLAQKGVAVVDCNIVYDDSNKSWEEWGSYVARTPNDNNHGYLPKGVLENYKYQAVYFDFYDDAKKDIWVFVNAETGDVLEVYEKK